MPKKNDADKFLGKRRKESATVTSFLELVTITAIKGPHICGQDLHKYELV